MQSLQNKFKQTQLKQNKNKGEDKMSFIQLKIGDTVFHNKTKTLGVVTTLELPIVTIKTSAGDTAEFLAHDLSKIKPQGSNLTSKDDKIKNMKQITKALVNAMKLGLTESEFVKTIRDFSVKIKEAQEKELQGAFPQSEIDSTVAQVDALTDINYLINGTAVETGVAPSINVSHPDSPTEKYPIKDRLFHQVAEFHEVGGHPVSDEETELTQKRLFDRSSYIVEEVVEFLHAISSNEKQFKKEVDSLLWTVSQIKLKGNEITVAESVDVVYGTSLETMLLLGLTKEDSVLFGDIVHNANMTKFYIDENGNYYAKRRESDGKIMKSPNFEAPEGKIEKLVKELVRA